MLYILTGGIQTGKTRWLERTIDALEAEGATCYGVLAPGIWVEASEPAPGEPPFEKLGIDNLLLPQRERIRFALREDLAREQGAYAEGSQASRAQLHWHISDEAIAQVNAHLASVSAHAREAASPSPGLLVIDELGRLELLGGEGLVEAMRLLDQGPAPAIRHALVVVRASLAALAAERYGARWGGVRELLPDDASREILLRALAS